MIIGTIRLFNKNSKKEFKDVDKAHIYIDMKFNYRLKFSTTNMPNKTRWGWTGWANDFEAKNYSLEKLCDLFGDGVKFYNHQSQDIIVKTSRMMGYMGVTSKETVELLDQLDWYVKSICKKGLVICQPASEDEYIITWANIKEIMTH